MVYRLEYQQIVKANRQEVWDFFSDHRNLQQLTPKQLDFRITYPKFRSNQIYEGMMIEYELKPPGMWRMTWLTEITHMTEEELFVDEMKIGPYKLWHHQHLFSKHEKGVLMTDILHYALPIGLIGNWFLQPFVSKQLKQIFNYREKQINNIFQSDL